MAKKVWKYYGIALSAVVLDQALKLWVYTHMQMGLMGQIKLLGNWFKLFYTLNPGMAFGIQFGFKYDKILLTIIRITATTMMARYIWKLFQEKRSSTWVLWGWALVLGGAAGNGIDSIFYGKLLHNAPDESPGSWFYGQVIDMLYLDVWSGKFPTWVPWLSETFFTCFPVFNLADVAILGGVCLIILGKNQNFQIPKDSSHELEGTLPLEITDGTTKDSENKIVDA